MEKLEVLCTVGPSSLNNYTLTRFEEMGVSLLRINLSHTPIGNLEKTIDYIRSQTIIPICLDTEGAQIRTGSLKSKLDLKENSFINLYRYNESREKDDFIVFYPEESFELIKPGDLISIDFNNVLVQVVEKNDDITVLRVLIGGMVRKNKAVTILDRETVLPALTQKDIEALAIGRDKGIRHVALSFANQASDLLEIKRHILSKTFLISKIESIKGLFNLDSIASASDAVLIDRGDLSRQVGIEQIPWIQKTIIKKAKAKSIKVYVATNLLESMVKEPYPTRAEVNDIFHTLADGADGLVLAAEAAIGNYPVHCVSMVSKMIEQFNAFSASNENLNLNDIRQKKTLLLNEPHGGLLVDRFFEEPEDEILSRQKSLMVRTPDILNVEQIALGTFSPLTGFMSQYELESVLENYRLPSGVIWPLPIVLQMPQERIKRFRPGDVVNLVLDQTDEVYATLHLESIYTYDLKKFCNKMFGTDDENHPGVKATFKGGQCFLAGTVTLIKRLPSPLKHYELTPRQARTLFENKGWNKVVGFHTHNVIHRAHEHIQMIALNEHCCDGLFIHPIIGPKKNGDYNAELILRSYELMLENGYYRRDKIVLAAFQNYSRYSGPREAVFTALCRKNFGCSHFIVGRGHTGVGDYYEPDGAQKFFEELEDLGIKPIFFNEQNYCKKCGAYVNHCQHGENSLLRISGTEGRNMLKSGKKLPEWFMRKEISELIQHTLSSGGEVFLS